MLIHLHSQATTTPKVRAAIQASTEPASSLAERFGSLEEQKTIQRIVFPTNEQTVYKWKHRNGVHDRSHTPHRLQTTLTPAQEAVAVVLRKTLLVSLDDLLALVREFLNPEVSRSGLDLCLRRHGVGNLRDLQAKDPRPKHEAFKAYETGYLHVDVRYLPRMADESSRRYLFVAIDGATRWVFIRIYKSRTAANARRFLRDLERACPIRIRTVLTDNGKEFTDRLFGLRKREATGRHEFDQLCTDLGIEHRLTPPQHPQTNGRVERFNGRIEEVLQSHHFHSGKKLETTPHRHVALYNQQLPQSALGSRTPLQAMKDWHKLKPELFRKQPYVLPGCDRYHPIHPSPTFSYSSFSTVPTKSITYTPRPSAISLQRTSPRTKNSAVFSTTCIARHPFAKGVQSRSPLAEPFRPFHRARAGADWQQGPGRQIARRGDSGRLGHRCALPLWAPAQATTACCSGMHQPQPVREKFDNCRENWHTRLRNPETIGDGGSTSAPQTPEAVMTRPLIAAALLALAAPAAFAGPIELACLRSDRAGANRSLCGCIQNVADAVLSGRDQRIAAKFFTDPDRSQEIRQSDRASDEAFWLRYRAFGTSAETHCAAAG